MTKRNWIAGVAVVAIVSAGCGDTDDSSSASADDWCELAARVETASDESDDAFELGPEATRETFERFAELLDEAARSAPDEILADVNTAADAIDTIASILDEADYDLTAVDVDRIAELEELGAESKAATKRIQEYNERECGIPIDDDTADEADDDGADATAEDDGADADSVPPGSDDDDVRDDDVGDGDLGDDDTEFAGDANSDWCEGNRELGSLGDRVEEMFLTGPDALGDELALLLDELRELAASAPPEIAADVATSLGGLEALDEALAEVDYDLLVADLSVLDELSDEMEAAGDRIGQFNEQVCGIVDDEPDDTDDASGDDDSFDPSAGSIRDQTIAVLAEQGFTEDEAACIFDGIDFTDPNVGEDAGAMLRVFDECGIDLARLAEIGESLGGLGG